MSIDFADGPVTNQSWLAGAVPVGAIIQATDEHIGKQHVHQVVPDIRWWFGFLKINKNSTYTCLQVGWSTILLVHIFAFKNDALNIAYTFKFKFTFSLLTVRSLEMSGILFNTSGVLSSGFSLSTSLILTFWNRNKISEPSECSIRNTLLHRTLSYWYMYKNLTPDINANSLFYINQ